MTVILVVEDDDLIRSMLTECFQCEGFNVFAAQDGKDAISQIKNQEPDIIVTDLLMPHTSGLSLVRFVHENYPHLKIIALTGQEKLGPQSYLQAARAAGAAAVFQKPVKNQMLIDTVKSLLAV
ncbi:MAG: response regulator [Gammaproteobacteria bacterium]